VEENMKKCFALLVTIILAAFVLLLVNCRDDPYFVVGDGYEPLPEEEILGATFYISDYITSDEAGSITANGDGTYTVKIRRRAPSFNPSAVFISGPVEFSDYYAVTCSFPEETEGEKPYRVYACASTAVKKIDDAVNADYPTAADLQGQVYFRDSVAIGDFLLSNKGVNTLTVKRNTSGEVLPYRSLFLYLYFNQADMANPNDYYTFTLSGVSGANTKRPVSPVIRAAAYRNGDTDPASHFTLNAPVLPDFDHRYDSAKAAAANMVSTANPESLCVDIQVLNEDVGKEFEFVIRNMGMYSGGTNQIAGGGRIDTASVQFEDGSGGASPNGTVTESTETITLKTVYLYTVKVKAVAYDDLFGAPGTGVKLKVNGPFSGNNRYTVTLNLPRDYTR
jgi:hypothetical protein